MKIMIIGGSGRVGTALTHDLLQNPANEITIAVGHPEKEAAQALAALDHVTVEKLELGTIGLPELTNLETGFDAIYFVAGSRGHDLVNVDSFGAIKTMIAAENAHVDRYIMLSSFGALDIDSWLNNEHYASLQAYQAAKFMADDYLSHRTNLNYTILQPSSLTEEPGTGLVTLNPAHNTASNPIPDVAAVLAASLQDHHADHQVITMESGQTPIETALDQL
ncbi:NAD(P)-binding oxidoreductase [Fructilactobacillus carniphilus]|uniref:SDR family oxidoreductase n=1 Tax=Fructilactobacillus carniphilus TaxID=2940297 RepID=A0ABY5C0A8_9LACO|nr:NAD(P)-binding oxidoreductase [Fructilactobacillus carniphilus]USS90715.1 SDR family oxidoreductase [Fructilactobacillus carniphilus]